VLKTSKVLECHRHELKFENSHDLHHGQAIDEQSYIQKNVDIYNNGGLWGDYTLVFWISNYLQHLIHVWNKNNGQIMVKVGMNMTFQF
jgi:hypothetical protein